MRFYCILITGKLIEKHINSSNIRTRNSLFKYLKTCHQDKMYKVMQSKQKTDRKAHFILKAWLQNYINSKPCSILPHDADNFRLNNPLSPASRKF